MNSPRLNSDVLAVLQLGISHYVRSKAGSFEDGFVALQALVVIAPDNPTARFFLGVCYHLGYGTREVCVCACIFIF